MKKTHNLSPGFQPVAPGAFGEGAGPRSIPGLGLSVLVEAPSNMDIHQLAQYDSSAESKPKDTHVSPPTTVCKEPPAKIPHTGISTTRSHRRSVSSRSNSLQSQTQSSARSDSLAAAQVLSRRRSQSSSIGIARAERNRSVCVMRVTPLDLSERSRGNSVAEQREIDFLFGEEVPVGTSTLQEMNRFSLRFESNETEDEYKSRLANRLGISLRAVLCIAVLVVGIFTFSSLFDSYQNSFSRFISGLVSSVILIILSTFTFQPSKIHKYYHQICWILFLVVYITSLVMAYLYGTDPIPRYHIFSQAIAATYLRTLFRRGFPIAIASTIFHCFFVFYVYTFRVAIQAMIIYLTTIPVLWYMGYCMEKFDRITMLTEKRIKESVVSLGMEKKKTMDVLHNIFPSPIADLLILRGANLMPVYAEEECTILLAEIEMSNIFLEKHRAPDLIRALHSTFKAMDKILNRNRLDKIKSYGFKYLAVGGLLRGTSKQSAIHACAAAIEISNKFASAKEFRIKVRIHTGPVYGLVIGGSKRSFDIYGKTVIEVYQLMKNSSEVLLLSESTKTFVESRWESVECECHGTIKTYTLKYDHENAQSAIREDINDVVLKKPSIEATKNVQEAPAEGQDLLSNNDGEGFSLDMQLNLILQRKDMMYIATMSIVGIFISYCGFGLAEILTFSQNPNWTDDTVVWVVYLRLGIFGPVLFALTIGLLAHNRMDYNYKKMILAMHQIPQMFLIIYGIWLPLKSYIYLESETAPMVRHLSDASTFQEPYVWLVVIICTPFMGREMTLASSAYWVLWWSPAIIIYRKNFGVSDFVDAIRSLITICILIALLVPYASKMKIGLLCQRAESRVQLAKNSLTLEKETKKSEHVALMVCDKETYTTLRDKRVQFASFYEELYIISIEIAQLDFIDSMKNLSDRTKTLMGIFDVIQNQAEVHGLQFLHGVGGVFTIVAGLTKSDDPLEKVVSFGCNIHKCVSVLSLAGTNDSVEVREKVDLRLMHGGLSALNHVQCARQQKRTKPGSQNK